jgi:hypothetical protein
MLSWLKKSKNRKIDSAKETRVIVNPGDYPAKILLAWSKAVEGNKDILKWLSENGYKELAVACWAINLEEEGRKWLMVNGYPHLMAFINAAEGNKSAQKWLEIHGFQVYLQMALAVDGDVEAYRWLQKNTTPDVFILTKSIEKAKDDIEDRHRDIHKFGDW